MRTQQTISNVLTFKRWKRTSYAVFSSLKKVVRIGVLSVGCSILVLPVFARESNTRIPETTNSDTLDLEEVVVSAQLTPMLQSELMRIVQVISRPEIEKAPVHDLASLLGNVRGVDIRTRGQWGMQADISIRGGSFDQTLILLNGINITDPQTGHHNLNLPVDLQSVERIEVLQGAGARIFGPNAFNGAVNIITRQSGTSGGSLSLVAGEYGLIAPSASGAFKTRQAGHFLSASGKISNGSFENSDFQTGNIFYRFNYPVSDFSLDMQAGFNQKAFGANSFYTPEYPEQFEETQTFFTSLQLKPEGKINFNPKVYWRRHTDRFELFRYESPEWYSGHNYHLTNIAGASADYSFSTGAGETALGFDYRYEHILSNVLGHELEEPLLVKSGTDNFYTHSYNRSGIGVMIEHSITGEKFSLSGGSLIYSNTDLEEPVTLFPGIDFAWNIAPRYRWFASLNRTLRLPTFTDLFYSGPTNQGNEMLLPEKAISLETGYISQFEGFGFDVAVFHRWGIDLIDWVKSPGDERWKSMNHTKVNIAGLETGIRFQPLSFAPYFTPRIEYTYIYADKNSDQLVSNYVLDHLKHKLDVGLNIDITPSMQVNVIASYRQREGGYMLYEDGVFTSTTGFQPYWLINARAAYGFDKWNIFADVSNMLNTTRVSIANVPQPGRWFTFGISYQFSSNISS
ncbi:MAG: TonB-dependent receptor plug domain-containing protein [Bacteroidota bacterium]